MVTISIPSADLVFEVVLDSEGKSGCVLAQNEHGEPVSWLIERKPCARTEYFAVSGVYGKEARSTHEMRARLFRKRRKISRKVA